LDVKIKGGASMGAPTRKQQLYAEILTRGFMDLRVLLTSSSEPPPQAAQLVDALFDVLHNLPNALLHPEFSIMDSTFLDFQARRFCCMSAASSLLYYDWYMTAFRELFSLVPEQLRSELKWQGPGT
jgi:hypothetical protein